MRTSSHIKLPSEPVGAPFPRDCALRTCQVNSRQCPYRAYSACRDSGVEWLGEIPAHWVVVRMWQVCEAISGGTPKRDEPCYWDGTIPWVSPKDMKSRLLGDTKEKVTERGRQNAGLKLIPSPAVLVVVRGMILAHSFPVAVSTVPLTINQDMKALKLRTRIEPRFFGWLLDGISRRILSTIVEKAAHGTRAIRMDHWRIVDLPLPPVIEQTTVADFLDRETAKIDALVAKKERLSDLLQEKRTALITRAVTKGLDPDVPMKDSGVDWLGEIPSHWERKRIAELALSLQTGPFGSQLHAADYITGGIPTINPANLISGTLVPDPDRTVDEPTATRLGFHKLLQGDILFARRGDVGRCSLVGKQHEGWLCGTGCLRMRPCPESAESSYLLNLLSTQGVGDWLGNESVGSTMQNLNTSIIGRIPIAIPGLAEQRRISEFLDRETMKIDALVAKVREAGDRLRELRTALISAAVTGKIDVHEAVP